MNSITELFKDKKGRVVLWQSPNAFLCGWAVFTILTRVLPAGRWQAHAEHLSFGFIFVWAGLEIFQGASFFRRILGAVVLLASIYSKIR